MFNSSPVDSWEGAAAIFNSAGSTGVTIWFLITIALCIIPVIAAIKHDNKVLLQAQRVYHLLMVQTMVLLITKHMTTTLTITVS